MGADLQVVLQDLEAAPHVGQRYSHVAIEAARPGESGVQALLQIGRRNHDDALRRLEPIHLQTAHPPTASHTVQSVLPST